MKRRRDYRKFKEILNRYGITKFYHFTDRSNVASIIANRGLWSWASGKDQNIIVSRSGGSALSHSLDSNDGLDKYVRMSVCRNHPMMYQAISEGRISDPIVLEIDTDILYIDGNIFSDRNANRNDAQKGCSFEHFINIHFQTALCRSQFDVEESERVYYQAEILVKDYIPLHYILNLLDENLR